MIRSKTDKVYFNLECIIHERPKRLRAKEEAMVLRRFALMLATAFAVGVSACQNSNDNKNNNENNNNICIGCPGGNGPTGTSSVNKMTISLPSTVCLDQKVTGKVTIDPTTTSAFGKFTPMTTSHYVIANVNIINHEAFFDLHGTKVGVDSVVYIHDATNKRQSQPVEVKDCSSGGGGGTTTTVLDSLVITPRGPQTFLVGTSEFYFAPGYKGGSVVKNTAVSWNVSSGSCASLSESTINSSGVAQIKVSANFAGTSTLTATAGGKTVSVPLTCRGVEGSYNGIWLEVAPLGWNTSPGNTKIFTVVVRGAPAGSNFKPYFYCSRFDIVSCVGQDTTYTNDARFGTGPQKGGTAKVVGFGSFNACYRLGATDYRAWTCVPVVSASAIQSIGTETMMPTSGSSVLGRPWYPTERESSPPLGVWQ